MTEAEEIENLKKALATHLEIIDTLSERLRMLEEPVQENAARQIAVMTLLRAVYLCSPNREQVQSFVERMAAQTQAQPGYILNGNSENFRKMKAHLDWMMTPPLPLD
ncbi:MAG: hypothetical protein KJZ76_16680 [Burkholderiaceae bacterium]|nr:hypothetical protein [Burkholderiaceae bacterium]